MFRRCATIAAGNPSAPYVWAEYSAFESFILGVDPNGPRGEVRQHEMGQVHRLRDAQDGNFNSWTRGSKSLDLEQGEVRCFYQYGSVRLRRRPPGERGFHEIQPGDRSLRS